MTRDKDLAVCDVDRHDIPDDVRRDDDVVTTACMSTDDNLYQTNKINVKSKRKRKRKHKQSDNKLDCTRNKLNNDRRANDSGELCDDVCVRNGDVDECVRMCNVKKCRSMIVLPRMLLCVCSIQVLMAPKKKTTSVKTEGDYRTCPECQKSVKYASLAKHYKVLDSAVSLPRFTATFGLPIRCRATTVEEASTAKEMRCDLP